MKFYTAQESIDWCIKQGVAASPDSPINFIPESKFVIREELPESVGKQEYWIREIFEQIGEHSNYLVWLTNWNEFSLDENILELVNAFRREHGEHRALGDAPAHLLDNSEKLLASGLMRFIVAFGWDACLVAPSSCPVLVEIHDQCLDLVVRDESSFQHIKAHLHKSWG